jgi:flagellin-specific chaperone FliS
MIEIIKNLRLYFPKNKGYNVGKIIQKLYTTLVKN